MEKEKNFEEKMVQLEEIVLELENGELNLDQSVLKFEEGIKIAKECGKSLDEAERKITLLLKQEDGEYIEKEFDK